MPGWPVKGGFKYMLPEKLEFLNRFDNFYQVITNAVKEDKVDERDFYALIRAKAKTMDQERREENSRIVKVIGVKTDLKYWYIGFVK